mmetsp:Transcript_21947/g.67409  ORF Transcript_21947/g.67409 Transcript_21947/m.67409 type:complete len:385 (-) Transcript_21947:368-1522(-)
MPAPQGTVLARSPNRPQGTGRAWSPNRAFAAMPRPPPAPTSAAVTPAPARKSAVYTDNTEYSTSQQVMWLLFWFVNNIAVSIVNKMAFSSVDFHYPNTLSAVHMLVNGIGANVAMHAMDMESKEVDSKGKKILVAFSVIFAANISVGNASINLVSLTFNQVMRSMVPAVLMLIAWAAQGKRFSAQKIKSVVPIILGVALATYGDMRFSMLGFFMTCLCVVFAALKAIAAGSMLTGDYKLGAFDLLSRMAPLSFCWMSAASLVAGEAQEISGRWTELRQTYAIEMVVLSALLSFTLNITSFMANKVTSALTLAIASNVKQVSLIVMATFIFQTPVSTLNALGISIVFAGSGYYTKVSIEEKESAKQREERDHGRNGMTPRHQPPV